MATDLCGCVANLPIIPIERLHTVCKPSQQAATCRYILAGAAGIECGKGSELATTIDHRVAAGLFSARGDNCSGPPDFTPKE